LNLGEIFVSKKSKRQVSRTSPVQEIKTSAPAVRSILNRPSEQEFRPDYSAVIKDLKRIGILAGSFFVLLIALSFIIPQIMR
jgi:hypothetical protein